MPHIIVTGAGRRLGLYVTEKMLARGWKVSAITRTINDSLKNLDQTNLTSYQVDYSSESSIRLVAGKLAESAVDVVFHNASFFAPDEDNLEASISQLSTMMQTHVVLPRIFNDTLKTRLSQSDNGNIVHMTDIYVDNPAENFSNYCASKAALENLSKSFAKKLAPDVRVNTIQPGALKFLPEHTEEAKRQVLSKSLIQREAGFDTVYQTLNYLIENTFITGTAIKVDGGRSICR